MKLYLVNTASCWNRNNAFTRREEGLLYSLHYILLYQGLLSSVVSILTHTFSLGVKLNVKT